MHPEISVIIPVYNIENYLEKCLVSLRDQTFSDLEILLVDDGSADGSGQICEQFVREDDRFRLIRQENQGLSKARETGVHQAEGQWIMFVDGDDWVCDTFCERALDCARASGADICIFEYEEVFQIQTRGRDFDEHEPMAFQGPVSKKEALTMLAQGRILDFFWNKIYRREVFTSMVFPEIRVMEDMRTMCRVFARASSFYLMADRLYYYRRREGSLTTAMSRSEETREVLLARYEKYYYLRKICPEAAAALEQAVLSRELKYYAYNYFIAAERKNLSKVRNRMLARKELPEGTTRSRKIALGILRRSGLLFTLLWRGKELLERNLKRQESGRPVRRK